ncbi:hypothetical protein NBRC10512_003228 [Rhodotorula toruloides]|uniref:RHTO0S05e07448g1_1 n=2 Tax=Rhodotorula toruloides TaxID=5286 RepID=A0A061AZH6_RHOTO|nr:uncharacterized protein RHTO_06880 [Rhodotorula toruloides NP11]EMS23821.1 hypothetical protein RHTO_06880 [Rhodotorula toruloides NP11]KAJ8294149.1 hypothetical protein OF846_002714 [Rhodotorula toruloides]CDR40805.1 RHTO0S05e07448g1_1 [Rhodotorula toruloides]
MAFSTWALVHTLLVAIATGTALLTFVLACAYTAKLQSTFEWYDPAGAELIAASVILLLSLPVLHFLFHRRNSTHVLSSILVELVLVFVLWCLFVGGAGALSSGFGWVWWGWTSTISGTGKATQAFAWLTWVDLTLLLAFLLTFAIFGHRNKGSQAWTQPIAYDSTTMGGTRHDAMTTEAKNAPVVGGGGNMGTAAAAPTQQPATTMV